MYMKRAGNAVLRTVGVHLSKAPGSSCTGVAVGWSGVKFWFSLEAARCDCAPLFESEAE